MTDTKRILAMYQREHLREAGVMRSTPALPAGLEPDMEPPPKESCGCGKARGKEASERCGCRRGSSVQRADTATFLRSVARYREQLCRRGSRGRSSRGPSRAQRETLQGGQPGRESRSTALEITRGRVTSPPDQLLFEKATLPAPSESPFGKVPTPSPFDPPIFEPVPNHGEGIYQMPEFPQANHAPGCHHLFDVPIGVIKIQDQTGMLGNPVLLQAFRCIYTAFWTLNTLISRHEAGRVAGVSYFALEIEPILSANFSIVFDYGYHSYLYQMREAFELAGLRMLSEFNLFIGHNFNCDLDNGDSPMLNPDDDVSVFIGVCSDFNTLSEEDRVLHTITTLLATSTRSNEPTGDFNGNLQFSLGPSAWGMAQWAFQRWEAHGECLHSTLHLDERPLDHERRQFDDDEYDYYIHNLNDSNTSIAQGWQRAFDLLEPGLRFIYRLALLDQADRERMWHYGDELSPAHYFGAYTDRRFAMVFHRLLTMMDRIQHTKIWIWYWPNDNSFGGRPTTLNNTIWFRTVYSQGDERSRGISMLHELMHDSMSGGGLRDWRRDYCDGGGRTTAGGKCYSALGADFGAGNDASCGVLAIRCRNPEHACSNIPNYVSWLDFRLEAGWRGWPPDTEVIGVPAFNTTDPAGEWVPDPVADPPFFDDPTPEQFIALVPETADWWEEGEFTPSSGDPSETGVECDEHALANNTWMCH